MLWLSTDIISLGFFLLNYGESTLRFSSLVLGVEVNINRSMSFALLSSQVNRVPNSV